MVKPKISMIAAISENRALGKDNKLLWHIPEDLKRFKKLTVGHPVIMGRTTYESIGKLLPDRINIVVTRNNNYKAIGCKITHSVEEAIEYARKTNQGEIFLIGGGQIYKQGIKYAEKLYLTIIKGNFEADAFFPDYSGFRKIIYQQKGNFKNYHFTFLELES
jgi:dihydrofolate reductase